MTLLSTMFLISLRDGPDDGLINDTQNEVPQESTESYIDFPLRNTVSNEFQAIN